MLYESLLGNEVYLFGINICDVVIFGIHNMASSSQSTSQARRWCFTRNYSDEEDFDAVLAPFIKLDVNYIIIGAEIASTGQKHLQGYVNLKKGIRFTGAKKLCPISHWEISKGSDIENRKYCSKDGVISYESGTPLLPGSNKRKMMELYREDPDEMRLNDPSRFRRCLSFDINNLSKEKAALVDTFPEFDRPWQVDLRQLITEIPDRRTIIWVCGHSGNEGKTTMAQSFHLKENYFYSRGGKADDVLYQYTIHAGHVVFDLPRDKKDFVQYSVMEAIKDRAWSSNKYEPISVVDITKFVHVIVMANFLPCVPGYCPDDGKEGHHCKLSVDRIKLIVCDYFLCLFFI